MEYTQIIEQINALQYKEYSFKATFGTWQYDSTERIFYPVDSNNKTNTRAAIGLMDYTVALIENFPADIFNAIWKSPAGQIQITYTLEGNGSVNLTVNKTENREHDNETYVNYMGPNNIISAPLNEYSMNLFFVNGNLLISYSVGMNMNPNNKFYRIANNTVDIKLSYV